MMHPYWIFVAAVGAVLDGCFFGSHLWTALS
jgi:hypothetical protein